MEKWRMRSSKPSTRDVMPTNGGLLFVLAFGSDFTFYLIPHLNVFL